MTRSRLTALLTAALALLAALVGAASPAPPRAAAGAPRRHRGAPPAAAAHRGRRGRHRRHHLERRVAGRRRPRCGRCCSDGATASLTVRSVHSNTCPVDGWLTLSAGQRAGDRDAGADTRPAVPGAARAGRGRRRAGLGHLPPHRRGRGLRRPHRPARRRAGPRRRLRPRGRARRRRWPRRPPPARSPATRRTTPARCRTTLSACPVDAGRRRRRARPGRRRPARRGPPERVAGRAGRGRSTPGSARCWRPRRRRRRARREPLDAGASERLRLAALRGPGVGPGTLESTSTRQAGLIQLADLTATVLARARPARPGRRQRQPAARAARPTTPPRRPRRPAAAPGRLRPGLATRCTPWSRRSSTAGCIVQILIYAFVAVVWRRRLGLGGHPAAAAAAGPAGGDHRRRRARVDLPGQPAAVVALPQPDARPSSARSALFVAVISAVALLGPWRRSLFGPPAVVSAATMVVLAADVMTGSRLQLSSLMGLQPVVGGRFYGMGNVTFALFATATLMLCIAVADHFVRAGRRPVAVGAVIAIGLAGVVVDASPAWGSDFGGPPAFLPALAFFVLAVAGVRLTWRRGPAHRRRHGAVPGRDRLRRLAAPGRVALAPGPVRADRHRRRRRDDHPAQGDSRTGTSSPAAR